MLLCCHLLDERLSIVRVRTICHKYRISSFDVSLPSSENWPTPAGEMRCHGKVELETHISRSVARSRLTSADIDIIDFCMHCTNANFTEIQTINMNKCRRHHGARTTLAFIIIFFVSSFQSLLMLNADAAFRIEYNTAAGAAGCVAAEPDFCLFYFRYFFFCFLSVYTSSVGLHDNSHWLIVIRH